MMMKKIRGMFSAFLLVVAMMAVIPFSVVAIGNDVVTAQGDCGPYGDHVSDVRWKIDSKGTLTIYGSGPMRNCTSPADAPWREYRDVIKEIVVEDGVTHVGTYIFYQIDGEILEKITIADSVQSFGTSVFNSYSQQENIKTAGPIGGGYDYEFGWSKYIPENAFSIIGNPLIDITLPDTIIKIGRNAFSYVNITEIDWPASLNEIGDYAFQGHVVSLSQLRSVVVPDSVDQIGEYAFRYNGMESLGLPDTISRIPDHLCNGCKNLKTINWPNKLTSIGEWSFASSGLETVTIPRTVQEIGEYAFYYCEDLQSITLSEGISEIKKGTFEYCGNLKSFIVPNTVKKIEQNAFSSCSSLTRIDIPESVTNILPNAFLRCGNLRDVYFSGSKEDWKKIQIDGGNETLTNANIHFNSPGFDDSNQSTSNAEEVHQFQNWDIFTNTVYFRDGTSYKLSDTYGSVNIEDLLDNWVVCTICKDPNKGNYITDMEKITSKIVVDITMDESEIFYKDNDLSFDGENYEWKSFFEIPYHVTVENRLSHSVDAATLNAMQAEDSPLNIEVTDVTISAPKGFNFGTFGGGEVDWKDSIVLRANEKWEGDGYIRADGDYNPAAQTNEYQMNLSVHTSSGNKTDHAVFTVEYVDYMMESVETKAKKASNELKKVADKAVFLSGEYSILRDEFGFTNVDVDSFKKSILIALASCTIPQDTLPDVVAKKYYDKFFSQYKLELTGSAQTVTLKYIFDTPKYGRLEVAVDCKLNRLSLSDTQFAMYGDIKYRVLNQGTSSSRVIPSSLKEGVLGSFGQCDIRDFADATYKLVEAELKQALYEPTAGNAVAFVANIVLSDTTNNIMKALNVSADDLLWKMVTYATTSSRAACPIDVYVYDSNGALCGSIVNNRIIKESPGDFCLRVKDDVKYVTGLDAGYKIEYVATDNGKMDVEITEEIGINLPLRTISFHDVKLDKTAVYEQITPSDLMSSLQNYQLIVSQNGQQNKTIVADEGEYVMEGHSDPSQGGSLPFTDVSASDWFYEKVQYVYENNIMVGVSNTKFDPYATLDRAQAVQILYNLEGQPRVTGSTSFSDVAGHWAIQAIQWASEEGIAAGDGDGTFRPNDSITREEFAQMLYNYSRYKWYDISASGDLAKFQDADKVSDWAITAIKWANGHGLINGHDDGTIDPQGPAQRCQAASILCQYNQAIKKH